MGSHPLLPCSCSLSPLTKEWYARRLDSREVRVTELSIYIRRIAQAGDIAKQLGISSLSPRLVMNTTNTNDTIRLEDLSSPVSPLEEAQQQTEWPNARTPMSEERNLPNPDDADTTLHVSVGEQSANSRAATAWRAINSLNQDVGRWRHKPYHVYIRQVETTGPLICVPQGCCPKEVLTRS